MSKEERQGLAKKLASFVVPIKPVKGGMVRIKTVKWELTEGDKIFLKNCGIGY